MYNIMIYMYMYVHALVEQIIHTDFQLDVIQHAVRGRFMLAARARPGRTRDAADRRWSRRVVHPTQQQTPVQVHHRQWRHWQHSASTADKKRRNIAICHQGHGVYWKITITATAIYTQAYVFSNINSLTNSIHVLLTHVHIRSCLNHKTTLVWRQFVRHLLTVDESVSGAAVTTTTTNGRIAHSPADPQSLCTATFRLTQLSLRRPQSRDVTWRGAGQILGRRHMTHFSPILPGYSSHCEHACTLGGVEMVWTTEKKTTRSYCRYVKVLRRNHKFYSSGLHSDVAPSHSVAVVTLRLHLCSVAGDYHFLLFYSFPHNTIHVLCIATHYCCFICSSNVILVRVTEYTVMHFISTVTICYYNLILYNCQSLVKNNSTTKCTIKYNIITTKRMQNSFVPSTLHIILWGIDNNNIINNDNNTNNINKLTNWHADMLLWSRHYHCRRIKHAPATLK